MSANEEGDKENEKKIKTSKSRRETAVQGTNDCSIVSKCSMAAQGYFEDPYLQAFVSKVTRRAPLIHRGYYIRAKTLDFILKGFLEKNKGPKQIISLGAGFDSAFFRLHSQDLLKDVVFFEVDFPEVVKRKCALIKANPDMMDMLGQPSTTSTQKSPLIEMTTGTYKLLGVDLAQTNTLEAALKLCGADFDRPTLLMSECVLTYMTRRCASGVVKWAAETFYNSVFVLYEQINPDDAFGLFMQHHFHVVGSPLKSINSFPTIQSQRERFISLGWNDVDIVDMNKSYYSLLSPSERDHVEHLELFDEYEEWHLKCAHYMVLCGYHGSCGHLLKGVESTIGDAAGTEIEIHDDVIEFTHSSIDTPLKRFGHRTIQLGDSLALSVGGFGEQKGKHMRVTDVTFIDLATLQTWPVDPGVDNRMKEVSRMHATATYLNDGSVILIGGRLSPLRLCTQIVSVRVNYGKAEKEEVFGMEMAKEYSSSKEINMNSSEKVGVEIRCDENVERNVNCGEKASADMNFDENISADMNCDEKASAHTNCVEKVVENCGKKNRENMNCDSQVRACENIDEKSCENINCEEMNIENNKGDKAYSELCLKSSKMNICENSNVLNNSSNGSKTSDKNISIEVNKRANTNCDSKKKVHSKTNKKFNQKVKSEESDGKPTMTTAFPELHVTCMVVDQSGDVPSPRWRHTAMLSQDEGGDETVIVYGGRTQSVLALGDCYMYSPATTVWCKLNIQGSEPVPRQSHTATLWHNHMVIAGGLQADLQPLASVHMVSLETLTWTEVPCKIKPRYSHTAHVIGDYLVLIGGVNFSHSPPGVALVHLPSGNSAEFSLPTAVKERLIMLHGHTSITMDNNTILLLGGGGNCFSFGTHLNSSPILMDIGKAIDMMVRL